MVASVKSAGCVGESGGLFAVACNGLCALSASDACRSALVPSGALAMSVFADSLTSGDSFKDSALRSDDSVALGVTELCVGMDSSAGNSVEGADWDVGGCAVGDATDLGTVPKRVWRSALALGAGTLAGGAGCGTSNRVCTGPTRSEVGP